MPTSEPSGRRYGLGFVSPETRSGKSRRGGAQGPAGAGAQLMCVGPRPLNGAAGQSPGPVVPLRQLQGRKGVVQFRRSHQPPQNPVKYMTYSPPGARTTCGSVA